MAATVSDGRWLLQIEVTSWWGCHFVALSLRSLTAFFKIQIMH